jgi:surfactin synthase thioesterase subunit
MRGWSAETTARFDLDLITSGHFFDAAAEGRVIRTISEELAPT